jgi:hypothetical protein
VGCRQGVIESAQASCLSFEEAATVFLDEQAKVFDDPDSNSG